MEYLIKSYFKNLNIQQNSKQVLAGNYLSKGYTLIEVLVAVVIIVIVIGFFSYFATSLKISKEAKLETTAASFARRYFDTLRSNWQSDIDYDTGELLNLSPPNGYSNYNLAITLIDGKGEVTKTYAADYTSGFTDLNSTVDYIRQIDLVLKTPLQEYKFSTQIVRPPNG